VIFRTPEVIRYWHDQRDDLLAYWHAMRALAFAKAFECAEALHDLAEDHRDRLTETVSDPVLNDHFLLGMALNALCKYAAYWDALIQKEFSRSWLALQDLQDSLRLIKRFGRRPDILVWSRFEQQCGALEKMYPYRVFVSSEIVHDTLVCSICGREMNDPRCPHIPGDLYRGQLALGIVRNIRDVHALALVSNPIDKRCVIMVPDDSRHFRTAEYLGSLLLNGDLDPFRFSGVKCDRTRIPIAKLKEPARDARCPCGSGLSFRDCCLAKGYIEQDHLTIGCADTTLIEFDDLLLLRRFRGIPEFRGRIP